MELIQIGMSQTRSQGTRMSAVVLSLAQSPGAVLDTLMNAWGKRGSPVTAAATLLSPPLFVS